MKKFPQLRLTAAMLIALICATSTIAMVTDQAGISPSKHYENDLGESLLSHKNPGDISRVYVPIAPSNLSAAIPNYAQSLNHYFCELRWDDNSSAEEGFIIQRKISMGGNWTTIMVLGENARAFRDNNLAPDQTFFYRVQAFDGTLTSKFSNEVNVTTDDNNRPDENGF